MKLAAAAALGSFVMVAAAQSCSNACDSSHSSGGCSCDDTCDVWGDCCRDKVFECGSAVLGNGTMTASALMPGGTAEYRFEDWESFLLARGLAARDAGACAKAFTECDGRGCWDGECALPCAFDGAGPSDGCYAAERAALSVEHCGTLSSATLDCAKYPSVCCDGLRATLNVLASCGDARVGCVCDSGGNGKQYIENSVSKATGGAGCIVACVQYDDHYVAAATAVAEPCLAASTSATQRRQRRLAGKPCHFFFPSTDLILGSACC
ncbi:unnamed protein product [Phaeothamnion confervicola]